ncbi:unnamed protein product [Spirodela intermedia]|uniref:Uncharacterized protein n=1 Tax=Spirodela intermedia TaxID=51605 RepID=A0A7I8KNM1_SPIIN|nr:unnamed protein product [Spirodela intermedia]
MEQQAEAARNAKESLDLAFQMSNMLETGLDRHTLSLLVALCDRGVNPESLAALIREFSTPRPATAAASAPAPTPMTPSTVALRDSYFRRLHS